MFRMSPEQRVQHFRALIAREPRKEYLPEQTTELHPECKNVLRELEESNG